jgi:hypothetical protein
MPGKTLPPRPSCPLLLRPLRVLYYCTSPFGWRPPLLARPCCCSIRTRWQRANCILDQGICHCRAYHAPLGLPRSAVWRALHRRHAGKLPYSLLCRPTGWTASFEGCARLPGFDEEARLLLYERQFEINVCASQRNSEAAHSTTCTTPQDVVFSRNSHTQ